MLPTAQEARNYETRFLKRVDAKNNPKFYNRHNNDHLFSYQDDRYKRKMVEMYGVEHPSHSKELLEKKANNNLEKYGVENVYQAQHIKEKIKQTNLELYMVEHPSHSKELLEKKANNNLEKYGATSTLQLPETREKALERTWTDRARNKRKKTNVEKYGHENPTSSDSIKQKVLGTRRSLSERSIVRLLREYTRYFGITLGYGWYQKSDGELRDILSKIQEKHGYYKYEALVDMKPERKYSASIKRLQERPIVQQIKKYKQKYGKEIKIGNSWDRKTEEELIAVLKYLENFYGTL